MNKKKHKIRSLIFRIFLILVAGLTVGLSVFSWNAGKLLGNQLPMPFGVGASVILTGSMEPTLKVNDLVIVTEQDSYEVGDIVVYQSMNDLIIHRIVSIDDTEVVTKGDANNISDDPIEQDQIKGKFVFRIPIIGFLIRMIKTVPGTMIVLALAVFLMYRSRRKERAESDKELEAIVKEIKALQAQQGIAEAKPAASAGQQPDDPVKMGEAVEVVDPSPTSASVEKAVIDDPENQG